MLQWQITDPNPTCKITYACNVSEPYVSQLDNVTAFITALSQADNSVILTNTYAYVHAQLYPRYVEAFETRCNMINNGTLTPLPTQTSNQVSLFDVYHQMRTPRQHWTRTSQRWIVCGLGLLLCMVEMSLIATD